MKLLVVSDGTRDDYDLQLAAAVRHLPTAALFAAVDELSLDLIEKEGIEIIVASGLPRNWCYQLRGMEIVTILFGPRTTYCDLADIVVDYKNSDGDHYFTGPSFDFTSQTSLSFGEVTAIVKKLDWDSNFFGINVAYISCLHLSSSIYKAISRFAVANNIDLIEYLCNCHDRRSVQIAEKEGFNFVDIRLTFSRSLENFSSDTVMTGLIFRTAEANDLATLEAMAAPLYTKSRYFYDTKFRLDKAREFFQSWIGKAVNGTFDDECWCLCEAEKILAFCSLRYLQPYRVSIGLLGVREELAGQGFGKLILHKVMKLLAERGVTQISVVTQGRNYAAQRLYQSAGFKTLETQLWYHKWR